jgi:hypothetical protein
VLFSLSVLGSSEVKILCVRNKPNCI